MTLPEGLHDRGRALWDELGQKAETPAGALALEACRLADRLDELDRVIAGKGVLNLMSFRLDLDLENEVGGRDINVRVEFSNVLAEARQQANTFRQILVSLGLDTAKPEPEKKGNPLDELANRRTSRGAEAPRAGR